MRRRYSGKGEGVFKWGFAPHHEARKESECIVCSGKGEDVFKWGFTMCY